MPSQAKASQRVRRAGLAAKGVRAEMSEKEDLEASYGRFMSEKNPAKREGAGKDLIRAVFGKDFPHLREGNSVRSFD